MRAHVPVELVTSGEVEQCAEVLVMWDQSINTKHKTGEITWIVNRFKIIVVIAGSFYLILDVLPDSEH